jgi:hypothetical protein
MYTHVHKYIYIHTHVRVIGWICKSSTACCIWPRGGSSLPKSRSQLWATRTWNMHRVLEKSWKDMGKTWENIYDLYHHGKIGWSSGAYCVYYIYTYIHIYIYTYIHIYIYTYIHISIHWLYVYMYDVWLIEILSSATIPREIKVTFFQGAHGGQQCLLLSDSVQLLPAIESPSWEPCC